MTGKFAMLVNSKTRPLKRVLGMPGRWILAAGVAVLIGPVPCATGDQAGPPVAVPADDSPEALAARIEALVRQLGSGKYIERNAAERELLAIGYDTFDRLKEAETDSDPEIAARSRFLTRKLTVDWTRDDDSPVVQELLQNYAALSTEERFQVVERLSTLGKAECLKPLCRIARFDQSDVVAKRAALALLSVLPGAGWQGRDRSAGPSGIPVGGVPVNQLEHADRSGDAPASGEESANSMEASRTESEEQTASARGFSIEDELGHSQRKSAGWLRTYVEQLRDPAGSAAAWQQHVDAELSEGRPSPLQRAVTIGLLQHVSELYEQLGRDEELLALLMQMVEFDENGLQGVLQRLVDRLIHTQNWTAIDQIVDRYTDRFREQPLLMYTLAAARRNQGEAEKAQELAEAAFRLSGNSLMRLDVADALDTRGLFDWAEREFRQVLDQDSVLYAGGFAAAGMLSAMLYDVERYADAADVLDGFLARLKEHDEDAEDDPVRLFDKAEVQELVRQLETRCDYYRACHATAENDPITARKYLEQAIQHDSRDIDVLIAMFRLPVEDVQFHSDVVRRIEGEADRLDAEIRGVPGNATFYNNWAWLIANTRGDQEKAVRYAHRAVELANQESLAGFLDTLGRAYYAKGDLENALKYQRRALELDPHTQQLKRQLELFERAHAE